MEASTDSSSLPPPRVDDLAPPSKRRKLNSADVNDDRNASSVTVQDAAEANPFAIAKERLHTSRIPSRLVGRETEEAQLRDFFESCCEKGQGGGLYICGHPGTGKTAAVSHLLRQILSPDDSDSSSTVAQNLPIGSVTFLNCMRLSSLSIRRLCAVLQSQVVENEIKPRTSLDLLLRSRDDDDVEDNFSSIPVASTDDAAMDELEQALLSRDSITVIVLDEIDHLLTSQVKKMLLYRLYELPHIKNSRVILAGIANTLDLPQRLLPNLAKKKMTPVTVNFKSYTAEQIAAIVRERLGNDADRVFDGKAIELMAKKVAETCLGDCRKALNICSQAVAEAIAMSTATNKPISIAIMNKMSNKFLGGTENSLAAAAAASQQRSSSNSGSSASMPKPLTGIALVVSSLPLQQQVALLAVQHVHGGKNGKDILLPAAFDKYKAICKHIKTQNQDIDGFASLCATLESNGLVRVIGGTSDAKKRKLAALVSTDDSVRALGDHIMLKQVLPPTAQ